LVPVTLLAVPLVPLLTVEKTISSELESVNWKTEVVTPELIVDVKRD
jgi:hypothetical protein